MLLATFTGTRFELSIRLNIANSPLFTSVQAKEIAVQVYTNYLILQSAKRIIL
jgi:hypothetical protein